MKNSTRNDRTGFTLIELLVVIAIIGTLVALLLPAVQSARESARRTRCINNLKQLGTAVLQFESTNNYLPNGWYVPGDSTGAGGYGGWCTRILPFIEQAALYNAYNWNLSWWALDNSTTVVPQVATYVCPSSPVDHVLNGVTPVGGTTMPNQTMAIGDYIILRGYNDYVTVPPPADQRVSGMLMSVATPQPTLNQVTDGTSQTVIIGERAGRPQYWVKHSKASDTNPNFAFDGGWGSYQSVWMYSFLSDGKTIVTSGLGSCVINCQNGFGVYSFHPGGVNVIFGDGSVHFFKDSLPTAVYYALLSKDHGETLSSNEY